MSIASMLQRERINQDETPKTARRSVSRRVKMVAGAAVIAAGLLATPTMAQAAVPNLQLESVPTFRCYSSGYMTLDPIDFDGVNSSQEVRISAGVYIWKNGAWAFYGNLFENNSSVEDMTITYMGSIAAQPFAAYVHQHGYYAVRYQWTTSAESFRTVHTYWATPDIHNTNYGNGWCQI
jgi:hypothetical protein